MECVGLVVGPVARIAKDDYNVSIMIKNPYINALLASLYITVVATIMFNAEKIFGKVDTFVIPILVISLFTFSAAIMGYLFFFVPLQLYIDKQTKQAVHFFLKTLVSFAVVTLVIVISSLLMLK